MNPETLKLIERPYQEVVDDILTAIIGGVVNEPIIFDIKVDLYPLAEPSWGLRSITGTAGGERHTFQKEIDYLFSEGDNAVIWIEGGTWPDDETTFYVDYSRKESRSTLTDINVGSVTRTLSEAIGREITTVYQQINRAYLSAFIDTAEGKSLDLVVAILGVKRMPAGLAVGQVTFFRNQALGGNITIPEGTMVKTKKGEASFRTTQMRTLQQGQVRINVPIRAAEGSEGKAGVVEAGTITETIQPIAGIERVTNFDETFLSTEGESDEELRSRARAVLQSLSKGTLAAISNIISEEKAELIEVWDPNGPPARRSGPGKVTLLVGSEPELFPGLCAAVEKTRAAGVQATLIARYVYFKPRIVVYLKPGLTPDGKVKVVDEIIAVLQSYVDGLSSGDPAEGQKILKATKGVDDVSDATVLDVIAWRADVGHAGKEDLVDTIMRAFQAAPSEDEKAQRDSINSAIYEISPLIPGGQCIADRKLVQGLDGKQATDEQIEKGEFRVVATVEDEDWWVVLDMERADILLKEKET